ncbi:hypothetical protein ACX80N_03960 [Arthrobacter sp. MDT2-16]
MGAAKTSQEEVLNTSTQLPPKTFAEASGVFRQKLEALDRPSAKFLILHLMSWDLDASTSVAAGTSSQQ